MDRWPQSRFSNSILTFQDKTFGLKNKKGGKAQKFIAQVEKQVKTGGDPRLQKLEAEKAAEKKKREDEKKAEEEKNLLFRPVQKIEAGKQYRVKTAPGAELIFAVIGRKKRTKFVPLRHKFAPPSDHVPRGGFHKPIYALCQAFMHPF